MPPKVLQVDAGLTPHAGQYELLDALNRYKRVFCAVGRRWGKTEAAKLAILDRAPRSNGRIAKFAYCAPTYKLAKPIYEEFRDTTKGLWYRKSDTDLTLWTKPIGMRLDDGTVTENKGGIVYFWSLEEHDNLRGRGLDGAVFDECADIVEAAYTRTVLPMLLDVDGWFLGIGTPKRVGVGATWFRREFDKAADPKSYPNNYSMSGPSHGNPFLPREALAELIASCADKEAIQEEIEARFLEDAGAVFERIGEAFSLPWTTEGPECWVGADTGGNKKGPIPGQQYVMGLDFARFDDYTVASIFEVERREQVFVYRTTGTPYEEQLARIGQLRKRWNDCIIACDETGVGAPLVERLQMVHQTGIRPRKWSSNAVKAEDVTRARQLFQRAEWRFLDVPWQRAEFRNYQREKLEASGQWRYTAPDGGHDDAVSAACLASDVLSLPFVSRRTLVVPPPVCSPAWVRAYARDKQRRKNMMASRIR